MERAGFSVIPTILVSDRLGLGNVGVVALLVALYLLNLGNAVLLRKLGIGNRRWQYWELDADAAIDYTFRTEDYEALPTCIELGACSILTEGSGYDWVLVGNMGAAGTDPADAKFQLNRPNHLKLWLRDVPYYNLRKLCCAGFRE